MAWIVRGGRGAIKFGKSNYPWHIMAGHSGTPRFHIIQLIRGGGWSLICFLETALGLDSTDPPLPTLSREHASLYYRWRLRLGLILARNDQNSFRHGFQCPSPYGFLCLHSSLPNVPIQNSGSKTCSPASACQRMAGYKSDIRSDARRCHSFGAGLGKGIRRYLPDYVRQHHFHLAQYTRSGKGAHRSTIRNLFQ